MLSEQLFEAFKSADPMEQIKALEKMRTEAETKDREDLINHNED